MKIKMPKNSKLNEPESWRNPKINVTTNLESDLWTLARTHNIIWKEALVTGINFILAEKGIVEYQPSKLKQKMEKWVELAHNLQAQVEKGKPAKSPEEEADEVLGKLTDGSDDKK